MATSICDRDISSIIRNTNITGAPTTGTSRTNDANNGFVGAIFEQDEDYTNSSILEFLNQEKQCLASDVEIESIFEEINRLSGDQPEDLNVEELIREAEMLISKQELGQLEVSASVPFLSQSNNLTKSIKYSPRGRSDGTLSEESTPREMKKGGDLDRVDNTQIESLTSQTNELNLNPSDKNRITELHQALSETTIQPDTDLADTVNDDLDEDISSSSSSDNALDRDSLKTSHQTYSLYEINKAKTTISDYQMRRKSLEIEPRNVSSQSHYSFVKNTKSISTNVDKSTSPEHFMLSESLSFSRERNLEREIELLQEKLKDTEERLQSLRLRHDALAEVHRKLRENKNQYREESERYKIEIQHLHECANVLRSELRSARLDRNEALELQKILQKELEESRAEKKKVQEQSEKDVKTIQDLQRQCKEMERILMRKHPDSVSALIVASKNPPGSPIESVASRNLLEQRIAQLEADAREQDIKAQKILANVQTRFSAVQSKYEQHIGDLETQVLSLQQINADLNEQIESKMRQIMNEPTKQNTCANSTQTVEQTDVKMTNELTTKSTQTDTKSMPIKSTLPIKKTKSPYDTLQSSSGRDDSHLLATIRGMRVDLAIKEKAMQRLTKELEECKKTIKKLTKENNSLKAAQQTQQKKIYDPALYSEQKSDAIALREALNKLKLLEYDYNALHDKRLQDLNTLQAAHERELASCHETVRILQQRLTERDEAFALQKRRKVPVDYMALKSKVSSLERRHTEREERLHMLVEALSKGRLNGSLDGTIT